MELNILFLLCFGMAIGAFAAGFLPLVSNLSPSKFKLLTSYGAGLLIGCALIIIIPEGIETMTKSSSAVLPHNINNSNTQLNRRQNIEKLVQDNAKTIPESIKPESSLNNPDISDTSSSFITKPSQVPEFSQKPNVPEPTSQTYENKREEQEEKQGSQHKAIGIALILGFCFMFLIDQFSGSSGHSHTHMPIPSESGDSIILDSLPPLPKLSCSSEFSAALGLLIHAAADGIAMGAASVDGQQSVGFVIFMAIILHKAPAALGLTTFLTKLGYTKGQIIRQLILFSLAAPIMAIFTHFSLILFHLSELGTLQWATGWLLLFSGGTFLYVATIHSFPTINTNGHGFDSYYEIGCIILGMLTPLILPLDE